jgi:hypothetical protein
MCVYGVVCRVQSSPALMKKIAVDFKTLCKKQIVHAIEKRQLIGLPLPEKHWLRNIDGFRKLPNTQTADPTAHWALIESSVDPRRGLRLQISRETGSSFTRNNGRSAILSSEFEHIAGLFVHHLLYP